MFSRLFFFIFASIVILPLIRVTTAETVLFSLISTEPVPDMKHLCDTEKQLLHKIAPVLKSSVHKKGVAGHFPRYSRSNIMLEIEIKKKMPSNKKTVIFEKWC